MNQDFASPEWIDEYPSFIRRDLIGGDFNWWAPERTGDGALDYTVGASHFEAALCLIAGFRDPDRVDYYAALILSGLNPRDLLFNILWAMRTVGPMESGFLNALAQKAFVGMAPAQVDPGDQEESYALACLHIARLASWPWLLQEELLRAMNIGLETDGMDSVARVICAAAAAGALH
jgi:hypothetical protein